MSSRTGHRSRPIGREGSIDHPPLRMRTRVIWIWANSHRVSFEALIGQDAPPAAKTVTSAALPDRSIRETTARSPSPSCGRSGRDRHRRKDGFGASQLPAALPNPTSRNRTGERTHT